MSVSERFQGANVIEAGSLSPYWGEHNARYLFASPLVKDADVLDIACGTGYGLASLGRTAKSVTGVDVDFIAAQEAVGECDPNAKSVLLGDGTNLPFRSESFDAITSFETLEHIHKRSEFLSELCRVLKKDGTLVLSTPNANYTKPVNGVPTNPFHVFEYLPEELRTELETYFEVEQFLGQSLSEDIAIPPFEDAQKRLPDDFPTKSKLFAWKVLNKSPLQIREMLSHTIWKKPFYPTENDYVFSADQIQNAPVLVAVCKRRR